MVNSGEQCKQHGEHGELAEHGEHGERGEHVEQDLDMMWSCFGHGFFMV